MPFPHPFVAEARQALGDPQFSNAGFVPLQEPVAIGYVIKPRPNEVGQINNKPIGSVLAAQSCSMRLAQEPTLPDLHWVIISQSAGAMLYTWQSGERAHHFLALASDEAGYRKDMERAAAAALRRKTALQLHHEAGLNYAMLLKVAQAVSGHYNNAKLALGLAMWLIEQSGDDLAAAAARADNLTHMKNPGRLADLAGTGELAYFRNGDTLDKVCRGAKIILDSVQTAA